MANTAMVNREYIPPSWMRSNQVPAYLQFRNRHLRELDSLLTTNEAETLILARFIRKRHSANNPNRPEFPFNDPKFPATPAVLIKVPGLEDYNVWLKDESNNPSGTHKARMAWEVLLHHVYCLEQKVRGEIITVPPVSIISSGSTALALSDTFSGFYAEVPKILCDEKIPEQTLGVLQSKGITVYTANFRNGPLTSDDILGITKNTQGIDLSAGHFARQISRNYYDWLCYEIFNLEPDVVIVPYGTGQLFDNLLFHLEGEVRQVKGPDPRFKGNRSTLNKSSIIGVSAAEDSVAHKLSSHYLPGSTKEEYLTTNNNLVSQSIKSRLIGALSKITEIEDWQLLVAKRIAEQVGINAEMSALAGLAWLLFNKSEIPKGSRIILVNTGNSKTED